MSELDRHFCATTFVVDDQARVLLLWHRKIGMWLPPGGHVEHNELPDDAAVREAWEETGIRIELVGQRGVDIDDPVQLVRPEGIQVEDIAPGHYHIDIIYFGRPAPGSTLTPISEKGDPVGWYGLHELVTLGANEEVRRWSERAVETVAGADASAGR